jgi:hypothetical protein
MLPLWENPPGHIRSGRFIWPSRCQAVISPGQWSRALLTIGGQQPHPVGASQIRNAVVPSFAARLMAFAG